MLKIWAHVNERARVAQAGSCEHHFLEIGQCCTAEATSSMDVWGQYQLCRRTQTRSHSVFVTHTVAHYPTRNLHNPAECECACVMSGAETSATSIAHPATDERVRLGTAAARVLLLLSQPPCCCCYCCCCCLAVPRCCC
jgi:hypothetical protein